MRAVAVCRHPSGLAFGVLSSTSVLAPAEVSAFSTQERAYSTHKASRVSSRAQSLLAGYTGPVASGKGCRIFRGFFHGRGVRHCNHTMSCRILQVRAVASTSGSQVASTPFFESYPQPSDAEKPPALPPEASFLVRNLLCDFDVSLRNGFGFLEDQRRDGASDAELRSELAYLPLLTDEVKGFDQERLPPISELLVCGEGGPVYH